MNQSRDGCQGELLPSPCSPAQQVVSSLCLVCLLALAVAWVIVFNMKSKTDELRVHIYQCAPTNTHLHWPPVYNNKNITSSEQSCSRRSCGILGAISPSQLNFRNREMNEQKINLAPWCEDAGLFSQLRQMLLLVVGAYPAFSDPPDFQHSAFDVSMSRLEFDCILLNLSMIE